MAQRIVRFSEIFGIRPLLDTEEKWARPPGPGDQPFDYRKALIARAVVFEAALDNHHLVGFAVPLAEQACAGLNALLPRGKGIGFCLGITLINGAQLLNLAPDFRFEAAISLFLEFVGK